MLATKVLGATSPKCIVQPFAPATNCRKLVLVNARSGRAWGTGDENAAQVKRLISRDKKEFMGNSTDILDKYTTEFGDAAAPLSPPSVPDVAPNSPNPFASPASAAPVSAESPFKASTSPPAQPFGAAPVSVSPFKKSSNEPVGLRPDMSPDPIMKETPVSFLKSITLTQVVLFLSFTTIIAIMLGTFKVVLGTGAIRLAGLD